MATRTADQYCMGMPKWFETLDNRLWLRPDEEGKEEALFIRKALRLRKGHAVLDAPCGAGRIAFHLAEAGCVVTGIDLRPVFVKRARRRFRRAHLPGTFMAMDLRDMDFTNQYHGIYNWFGSFGYFSDAENREVVRLCVRALRKGGRLLIDQPSREHVLRNFLPEIRQEEFVALNRWNPNTQRVITRRIVDGKDDPGNKSSMRLYTPKQMDRLFERAGLAVEHRYGSLAGDEYSRSARRLITVGRKV